MLLNTPAHTLSFRHWIWKERESKWLLIVSCAAVLVQFIIFKILYPFANLANESYVAIEAAHKNWSVGYMSIGYPMFLRLVSSFTTSDTVLVFLQYLLLQTAILYLLFSIKYLLITDKWLSRILISISVLNPLLLYVSNLVTSDCLVATLMLVWFTHLLWIIHQPRLSSLLWHSTILILLFMVKHNVWYCALVSALVFFFLPVSKRTILTGIGTMVVLYGALIGGTQMEFKRRSDQVQFSAYWGWQKAANALFAYAHADTLDRQKVRGRFRQLHGLVNEHMAGLSQVPAFIRPDRRPGNYYLERENSPLKAYMREVWAGDDSSSAFKKWASVGPLYAQYGNFLVSEYPSLYWQYYILPNIRNYYVPETEALSTYNRMKDTVGKEAVAWFQWKSNKVTTSFKSKSLKVPYYSTVPLAVINIVFTLSFLAVLIAGGFSSINPYAKRMLLLLMLTWVVNLICSVLASYIVLRQQLFTMQLTFTFGVLFVYLLAQMAFRENIREELSPSPNFQPEPL